jgi:hypothetical protein
MNDALGKISILLLLFYMGWFILDQNKLIQNQRETIQSMKTQLFLDEIILKEYQKKFKTQSKYL